MPDPDDLAPLPATPPGRYRHYKGGEYEVIGVARHSETQEPLVVYRPLYNATGWWVRPHAMFFGEVTIEGVRQPRFARVDAGAGAGATGTLAIAPYDDALHREAVVALWNQAFGYADAHNNPQVSLDRKIRVDDGLFFVAVEGGQVVGTTMAGYDGHRGWIYSVAVRPEAQRRGIATRLVRHAEQALAALGCPKINLQVMGHNTALVPFYERLGYRVEPRISFGKRLL